MSYDYPPDKFPRDRLQPFTGLDSPAGSVGEFWEKQDLLPRSQFRIGADAALAAFEAVVGCPPPGTSPKTRLDSLLGALGLFAQDEGLAQFPNLVDYPHPRGAAGWPTRIVHDLKAPGS